MNHYKPTLKSISLLGFILFLVFISHYTYARAFGHISASHMSKSINKRVKSRLIKPYLSTKKYPIQIPKKIKISHNKRYLLLFMENKYISVWDLHKSIEIDHISLQSFNVKDFTIDDVNKRLYFIDNKGMLYSKSLVLGSPIIKQDLLQNKSLFSMVQFSQHRLFLATKNNNIVILNLSLDAKKNYQRETTLSFKSPIVSMAVSDNQHLLVATKDSSLFLYQPKKQNLEHSLLQQWQLNNTVQNLLLSPNGMAFAVQFKDKSYAISYHKVNNQYSEVKLYKEKLLSLEFFNEQTLLAFSQNNEFFKQDVSTGKTFQETSITAVKADHYGKIYSTAQTQQSYLLIPKKNKGIYLVQTQGDKRLGQLISTTKTWAIVDQYGRYDGNLTAFEDVVWDANSELLSLDQFSEQYFEPGLLSKLIKSKNMITTPQANIEQGLYLPPQVEISILSNNNSATAYSNNEKISIKIVAQTSNYSNNDLLTNIKLFHNGKRVKFSALKLKNNQYTKQQQIKEWQANILPNIGNNQLIAQVSGWEDIVGNSQTIKFSALRKNNRPTAQFFIKSIGINQYGSDDLTLNFAVPDATAIFDILTQSSLIKAQQTSIEHGKTQTLIINKDASKKKILAQLDALRYTSHKNDSLLVYMAGHGIVIDNQWYFLPQEARSDQDTDTVSSAWLSSKDFMEKFIAIPSQQIVLVIDACQSGAATVDFNDFHQRRSLNGLSKETGIHIIAATRADQNAPEFDELGHGLFTYALLKGMSKNKNGHLNADKNPKDGVVSVIELQDYVLNKVPLLANQLAPKMFRLSRGQNTLDDRIIVTPMASSQGKDFIIFK